MVVKIIDTCFYNIKITSHNYIVLLNKKYLIPDFISLLTMYIYNRAILKRLQHRLQYMRSITLLLEQKKPTD